LGEGRNWRGTQGIRKPNQIYQPLNGKKGPTYCSIPEILRNKSSGYWPKKEKITRKNPHPMQSVATGTKPASPKEVKTGFLKPDWA